MSVCRGCGSSRLSTVLDLGRVPAADYFPPADEPVGSDEASHSLAMVLCNDCTLAQLADDDTVTQEPRGVEPQALRDQAADAVSRVARDGWLKGDTVVEFGSPHGGTWLPLLVGRGFEIREPGARASVVLDSLGVMHDPDQRAAFKQRAASTVDDGVLLIHFHSMLTIVTQGQWNALRHGHFAYYSIHSLKRLLESVQMSAVAAWEFDLYGGTVLVAAVHGQHAPDSAVTRLLGIEAQAGITDPSTVRASLQGAVAMQVSALRAYLGEAASVGRQVFAYGAASRAVALFGLANVDRSLVRGVADASEMKQGRRMPGTNVPIISPETLVRANPDQVLLTLPDLIDELRAQLPSLEGKWVVDAARP